MHFEGTAADWAAHVERLESEARRLEPEPEPEYAVTIRTEPELADLYETVSAPIATVVGVLMFCFAVYYNIEQHGLLYGSTVGVVISLFIAGAVAAATYSGWPAILFAIMCISVQG